MTLFDEWWAEVGAPGELPSLNIKMAWDAGFSKGQERIEDAREAGARWGTILAGVGKSGDITPEDISDTLYEHEKTGRPEERPTEEPRAEKPGVIIIQPATEEKRHRADNTKLRCGECGNVWQQQGALQAWDRAPRCPLCRSAAYISIAFFEWTCNNCGRIYPMETVSCIACPEL